MTFIFGEVCGVVVEVVQCFLLVGGVFVFLASYACMHFPLLWYFLFLVVLVGVELLCSCCQSGMDPSSPEKCPSSDPSLSSLGGFGSSAAGSSNLGSKFLINSALPGGSEAKRPSQQNLCCTPSFGGGIGNRQIGGVSLLVISLGKGCLSLLSEDSWEQSK